MNKFHEDKNWVFLLDQQCIYVKRCFELGRFGSYKKFLLLTDEFQYFIDMIITI